MSEARISPRAAHFLVRHLGPMRRLRIAVRDDPELYAALLALVRSAAAFESGSVNGTKIAISENPREDSHMNVREAARRSGISERAIVKEIAVGRLKAHRGGGWCIHSLDLATWAFNRDRRERRRRERNAA